VTGVNTKVLEASISPPAIRQLPSPRCIMHVTWSMVAGGAEVYALTLLRNLQPDQFRGAICAIDQGGALEPEFRRLGIPCHIMHRKPGIEWSLIWRLYRLFRDEQVDVVHTHHFNQIFYSALAARLAGARLVHTEHSVELYDRPRRRIALRLLSMLCQQVLAVGDDVRQFLIDGVGIAPGKVGVINVGVDVPRESVSRVAARRSLGLDPHARIVVIIARLYPEKNHGLLLRAFARVTGRLPDARLLIVGGGVEEQSIRRQIAELGLSENVDVLGVRRDIDKILTASDLVALTSDREGLPIAVLEAMALARPVVVTAVGELPAIVNDGTTGRVVPPADEAKLADAIYELLCNPPLCAEMGENGRRFVAERFNIKDMIDSHQAIYRAR
jgi:glycosyltransferase involved in cell wall biosynthesis